MMGVLGNEIVNSPEMADASSNELIATIFAGYALVSGCIYLWSLIMTSLNLGNAFRVVPLVVLKGALAVICTSLFTFALLEAGNHTCTCHQHFSLCFAFVSPRSRALVSSCIKSRTLR